ncbi:hypothetical protein GCM10010842_34660 [Deinococcus daejeonensis]|uniref:Secreted protein n=1 Tax=Deinococcus daejeonensis TaxID=1007098 RepID=A0ABQ2JEA1_9DEIO|nr:hypothetical protein GCM10010842_34660 [Deinococcus daejeonensis]
MVSPWACRAGTVARMVVFWAGVSMGSPVSGWSAAGRVDAEVALGGGEDAWLVQKREGCGDSWPSPIHSGTALRDVSVGLTF